MLGLQGGRVESLWDEVLPERLRVLPEDLARIDGLLRDEALLAPIEAQWEKEAEARGRSAVGHGRPTIPMQTYVRLMVLKHRFGWGYETLMREVSDSLHLRRFCLISIEVEVPDESTVRKLTRRLGAETVAELSRLVIAKAQRETRFRARAVGIDSTVVEADVRYPTDAGLAGAAVRTLAREGKRLAARLGGAEARVRDRSRAVGKRLRAIARTLRRRTGEAKAEVLALTAETGRLLAASVRETRALAAEAGAKARALQRSRSAKTRRKAARILASVERLETLAERSGTVSSRSESGWPASRSAIGSSRSSTRTRARSARASWAARPSSATSPKWRR
jgi:IS5 family transposase